MSDKSKHPHVTQAPAVTTRSLHTAAMAAADEMFVAKRVGDVKRQVKYAKKALELELEALRVAIANGAGVETRNVLRRSATFLSINARQFRAGEDLVLSALNDYDDDDARDQWFALLEQVRGSRHLDVKGQQLTDVEIQLSLAGPSVQPGLAPHALVNGRVDYMRSLMLRHSKLRLGLPFNDDSRQSRQLGQLFHPLLSVARAASYAVTLRFTQSTEQLALPLEVTNEVQYLDATRPQVVLRDVMNSAQRFKAGGVAELGKHMDSSYARAIGGLFEQLSPDAKRLDVVGLTLRDGNRNEKVELPMRKHIAGDAIITRQSAKDPSLPTTKRIVGVLLKADGLRKLPAVSLVLDDETKPAIINYDLERWSDVVPTFWSKRVEATVQLQGGQWMLAAVELSDAV